MSRINPKHKRRNRCWPGAHSSIPYELWTEQGAEKDNSVIYKGMTACAPEEALTRRLDPQGLSIVTLAPAATALSWGSSSSSSNGNAGPATSAEATTASSPIREEPVGTYTAFGRKEKAGDNSTGLVAAPGAYPGADQLNVTLVANLLAQYASGKRVAARRRSKRLDPLFEKLALAAQRSGEASFEAYAPQRAAVTPLSASVGPRGRILNTCFKFNLWCVDNELELYNLAADPFEMENLYSNAAKHAPWLVNRLNALLAVITACEGLDCADPVRAAHAADLSSGAPMTFEDSLAERHDAFYASLPRPRFRKCLGVYDHDNELNWFRAVARQRKANPPPTAALVEGDLA